MCYTGVELYSLNANRSGVAAFQILLFLFYDFIEKQKRKKEGKVICLVRYQRRQIVTIIAIPIPVLCR